MPCPDLEALTAHGPTVGLVLLVLEWLIVAVFVGRKSRKRIAELEREVKQLRSEVDELNENRFIQLGKKYRA
jgi:uncharacterized membrane protein YciS (DUF1049 family)